MTLPSVAVRSVESSGSVVYGYTSPLKSYSAPGWLRMTRRPWYRVWGSSRGGLFVRLYREV